MSAPWQHGDLVTVADLSLTVFQHDDEWVAVVPENGDCGFTVHQNQIQEPTA